MLMYGDNKGKNLQILSACPHYVGNFEFEIFGSLFACGRKTF